MNTPLILCIAALLSVPVAAASDAAVVVPDLAGLPSEHGWKLFNRSATAIDKDGSPAVRLEGAGGHGFARLADLDFADGTIEFDVRGKDVVQGSFVGLAFHGTRSDTYDAVYFRPFNFRAADPARRAHAVQYISLPAHPWQRLRADHPGRYEQPVAPVPDPNGWFHVRIEIAAPTVRVYVDGASAPCLAVELLGERDRGWLALWVDVAGGDFSGLRITPAP